MPTLTIDGKTVHAREGAYLLEAARQAGIDIPTLCHHEAVEPWGGCRLCMVDVTRREWDGWYKLVAACLFPVEEGLVVETHTQRVNETRQVVLDLLLARCPETPLIRELAAKHGLPFTTFVPNPEKTDCILCGLCTRVCDALGIAAISAVDRGVGREIAPPFHEAPPACIGCLACAEVCPTHCIPYRSSDKEREIWGKRFEMERCASCGKAVITKAQAAFYDGKNGVRRSYFGTCDACKRKNTAAVTASLGVIP